MHIWYVDEFSPTWDEKKPYTKWCVTVPYYKGELRYGFWRKGAAERFFCIIAHMNDDVHLCKRHPKYHDFMDVRHSSNFKKDAFAEFSRMFAEDMEKHPEEYGIAEEGVLWSD